MTTQTLTPVKFHVLYNPAIVEKIGDLMNKFDLGIDSIEYPIFECVSYKTTTKVNTAYIKKMKKAVQKAYESGGCKIIEIAYVK